MRRFVSIDLETSGLNPKIHEIIEVGAAVEQPRQGGALHDSVLVESHTFSLPFHESWAEPKALEVNGWGTRPFPPERNLMDAAEWLAETLEGVHLVGKNPHFDVGFLTVLLDNYGLKPTWHHRLVDVGSLAWGWFNHAAYLAPAGQVRSQPQPPNSAQVAEFTGVEWPEEGRHTALVDALWAYRVFRTVVPPM